jgi:hypothetical protein
MFSKDIEELFKKKQYDTISDIYSLLEGTASDLFFSQTSLKMDILSLIEGLRLHTLSMK